ncbi:hypothetical protein OG698_27905 [Streptomyces sp. NBC_01003]|uniref:alpha/beta hydrolase family protein n=1 Tax=Streptomyces sp. NBC_01003 TaxID=2903714 RepID=UPI00386463A4|nr:hypothetical protein OG698_27905 [Streptomyces sp. NBC_01003]
MYGTPRNGAPELAALPARHAEPFVTRYRELVLIVQGAADTTVPAVTSKLAALPARHAEPFVIRYGELVLIVQGAADTTVPDVTSKETAAALERAGTRVTYTSYEGVDHPSLPVAALDEVDALTAAGITPRCRGAGVRSFRRPCRASGGRRPGAGGRRGRAAGGPR